MAPAKRLVPALVFLLSLLLFWLRLGHWFYLSIDEGIYLEGARRVAGGEVPYRDFFAVTGPATFWLYGAVFHVFGVTLAGARFVLCCELALIAAAISIIVGRVASAAFAAASALLFVATLLTTLYPLYITHRWDSNTCALVSLALLRSRDPSAHQSKTRIFFAGLAAALAAWFTPPLIVIGIALAIWIARTPSAKPALPWYAFGAAIPSAIAIAVLSAQHATGEMLRALFWDAANYAAPNRLPYGALTGALQTFWHAPWSAGIVHTADALLPAALPIAAAFAILSLTRRDRSFSMLLGIATLAAFLACLPRLGSGQLLFAAPFFWAACCCAAGAWASTHPRAELTRLGFFLASFFLAAGWPTGALKTITTPAGSLSVSRLHYIQLNDLMAAVKPRDTVFVYPYLPALYFALGVRNPTRYEWLQPGMMEPRDAASVLASLTAAPPRWVIWHDFTEAFILKNWPATNRTRLHFPEVEAFLETRYHPVTPDGVVPSGYRLLELNP